MVVIHPVQQVGHNRDRVVVRFLLSAWLTGYHCVLAGH